MLFRSELIFENDPPSELCDCRIQPHAEQLESRFRDALSCRRFRAEYSDMHASAIIKDILCLLLQLRIEPENKNTELIHQVILYIQKNYDKNLTNAEIAATFGYHPFYLNRIFKQLTGFTLHQTLLNERIRIAKKLLANTDMSIEGIVAESGFCDRSQFGVTFKKIVGLPPNTYRTQKKTYSPPQKEEGSGKWAKKM